MIAQAYPQVKTRADRDWKYHICSKTGRWLCARAGSFLPESTWGTCQYCQRVRDKALSLQFDKLGNVAIYFAGSGRKKDLPFENGDYIFVPGITEAVREHADSVKAYVVREELTEFVMMLGDLTEDEREIILKGCLINYNNKQMV